MDNSDRRCYGIGRSRSSKGRGEVLRYHLHPYVNCIHTWVGGGFETMLVMVGEVYEN